MEYSLFPFIAKKIVSLFLMPLSWWFISFIIGLLYLYRNKIKRAKIVLTLSLFWLILISYAPFANLLIAPLENYYPPLQVRNIPKDIKYIFILGGDINARTWEIMRLYNKISNIKIITSGRSIVKRISEAKETEMRLISCGIPKEDIIMNESPRDTQEEVEALKELIGTKPFILVTSAYHMPRSMLLFKSKGLNPIPAPTDLKVEDTDWILSPPSLTQLRKTEIAWHEYIGLVWTLLKKNFSNIRIDSTI